jgi:hypothetical protein
VTTAEQFRDAATHPTATVSVAGVAWPAYKLVSLLIGLIVFGVIGVVTTAAGPAVLSGAGVATGVWLTAGLFASTKR